MFNHGRCIVESLIWVPASANSKVTGYIQRGFETPAGIDFSWYCGDLVR